MFYNIFFTAVMAQKVWNECKIMKLMIGQPETPVVPVHCGVYLKIGIFYWIAQKIIDINIIELDVV